MDSGAENLPDVYDWICHLPPPSRGEGPFKFLLFQDVEFIAKGTYDGWFSFSINIQCWLDSVQLETYIKWSDGEESNNMQVITSPLLSLFIAFISRALNLPLHVVNDSYGFCFLSQVAREPFHDLNTTLTQSSNYPHIFNSALACICVLLDPRNITLRSLKEIISPELVLALGAHLEERLIRRLGSIFTYFVEEPAIRNDRSSWECLSWSYARNTCDSCELKIYCPLLSCKTTKKHKCEFPKSSDGPLCLALEYQQLESVIQLRYDVDIKENFLHLHLGIDNLRCDVVPYEDVYEHVKLSKKLLSTERYFPSKICLTITPDQRPSNYLSISINQSSANPTYQIATGKQAELSYQAPKDVSVKTSTSTSSTTSISNWEFEQSAQGVDGTFRWTLYDSNNANGTEVISSKPLKFAFFKSKPAVWYRDRYRKACSPFNKDGGVVFARDKYGQTFTWKWMLNTLNAEAQTFKCKIQGTIWLSYWPNVYNTSFYESRYHEFCEMVELPLKAS